MQKCKCYNGNCHKYTLDLLQIQHLYYYKYETVCYENTIKALLQIMQLAYCNYKLYLATYCKTIPLQLRHCSYCKYNTVTDASTKLAQRKVGL